MTAPVLAPVTRRGALRWAAVAAVVCVSGRAFGGPVTDLSAWGWSNRLIVVHPAGDAKQAVDRLRAAYADVVDRDVLWFVLEGREVYSNFTGALAAGFADAVRRQLRLRTGEAVLVGKDGGVKARSGNLDEAALFALIDTMPMRQREMRDAAD
ncbi:MAG: DUF4174 domain-containing protein [Pseudomonadota bacterium]